MTKKEDKARRVTAMFIRNIKQYRAVWGQPPEVIAFREYLRAQGSTTHRPPRSTHASY